MSDLPVDTSIVRYAVVSQVLVKVANGLTLSRAVYDVAKMPHYHLHGKRMLISVRTLQRWVAAYQAGGIDALKPASRVSLTPSKVLPQDFLCFLVATKAKDPDASIPEVIRRAEREGILKKNVSRVSVWRAATKLNLPIFATKGVDHDNMRRYAFAHRMQMVLADGKHFRAGIKSCKRIVITLLDDASRFALGAVVGTSESAALFLRGFWKILKRWGFIDSLFLDNGSGFIAKSVATIAGRLGIGMIHGTANYPEGRGKIERYHRTLNADLLRSLPNNPTIDPDLEALELRIEHYLQSDYNRRGHESLGGVTPEDRFLDDNLALRALENPEHQRQLFIITQKRKVSRDNIVMVSNVPYEMPSGYAGKKIDVYRHLLDGTITIIHNGFMIELKEVDLQLNAFTRRCRTRSIVNGEPLPRPTKTAATILFERDYQPLVSNAGDCFDNED